MARQRRRQQQRPHSGGSSSHAEASGSGRRPPPPQQQRTHQRLPSLPMLLPLALALALVLAPTPAAAAFLSPQNRPSLVAAPSSPRPRAAAGTTALWATTTTTSTPTSGTGSAANDDSSSTGSGGGGGGGDSLSPSLLRVRRATRADLRRVATMQVMEYGGEGLAFAWHYLQELDRLQTSFWVDPDNHAMLVVEDTGISNPSTPTPTNTPPASTVPFGALGALLLGDPSVVGFVDLDARDRRVDRSTPDPYLSDLIVDPARRGQGLGRLLMAEAEAVARGMGFPAVYLKVRKSNVRGLALYGALGYVVVKEAGPEGILTMRKWVVDESEQQLEEERRLLAAAASIMTPFFFDPTWSSPVEGKGEEEASQ